MDSMMEASREISGNYAKSMSLPGDMSTAFEALERAAYAADTSGLVKGLGQISAKTDSNHKIAK